MPSICNLCHSRRHQHRSLASPALPINFYLTLIANYYLARFFAGLIDGQSAPLDLPASALIEFSSFARSWLLFSSKRAGCRSVGAAAGLCVSLWAWEIQSPGRPVKWKACVCSREREKRCDETCNGENACCLYFCTCHSLQRAISQSVYRAARFNVLWLAGQQIPLPHDGIACEKICGALRNL